MRRFADISETVPRQFSVAGAALKPFCIGHSKLFKFLDLPFQYGSDDECSLEDAIMCASICSFSYEQSLSMISGGEWQKVIKDWRKRICGFGFFRSKKLDADKIVETFKEYIKDGYRMPPLWVRPDSGSSIVLTAPRESMILNRLAPLGYSTVMNMYLPEVWYQFFSAIEIASADRFKGEPKNWKKMFFTAADAERLDAVDRMNQNGR